MFLNEFDNAGFDRGASRVKEALWLAVSGLLVASWLPGSHWRVALLRAFGARIAAGVVIKPHVRVKFPWRLEIGAHSWIGESVWIDNLAAVRIGKNVCISQGVYLCTGSHDWNRRTFDLRVGPIELHDHVWLCAMASVAPGTVVGEGAIIAMRELATGFVPEWTISRARGRTARARPE